VISFDSVSKQYGKRILFMEASANVQRGEKVGLVGPNGAGKTTVFRLITGEEETDVGQVVVERGVRVGYFSQDVGELNGASVLAVVLDGVGPVAALLAEMRQIEEASSRWAATRWRARPARSSTASASATPPSTATWARCRAGGRCASRWRGSCCMRPDVLLLDEPTNHLDIESILWLENFLKELRQGALLMTSHDREFMNRVVKKIIEIDGGELTTYSGDYDFYEQQRASASASSSRPSTSASRRCSPRSIRFIERFKARARHAAQVQSAGQEARQDREGRAARAARHVTSTSARRRARATTWSSSLGVRKAYGKKIIYGLRLDGPPARALVRDGRERRRQVDAAEAGRRRAGSPTRHGHHRRQRQDGLLRPARDGAARPEQDGVETFEKATSPRVDRHPAQPGRRLRFSGDDVDKPCRILSGGEKARSCWR
jgi:ATPase subunit of ABC transporter with duplicated ATPase domains